jgi:imidazolonepropionase-like amidohydrolase
MKTLLKHANYLDVSYQRGFISKDILIDNDRITRIDDRIEDPRCDIVIDLGGYYVLPGLIDLHVHLCWDGSIDPVERLLRDPRELTLLRMVQHAQETLLSGITTVRDLGSVDDLSIMLSKGICEKIVLGPRIIAAGKSIIMTGGHDPFWGICVDGPWEAVKAVRKQAEKGAQVIKVSATGGVYGRMEGEEVGQSELTRPELEAICGEAHRLGLRVASHAIGEEGIDNSVRAGCDTIEHGILVRKETLHQMMRQGTFLTPTLFIYKKIAEGNAPAYAKEKAERVTEQHHRAFWEARAMGIKIAAGSDAGSPEAPHPSLFQELEAMVKLGLSPLEVTSISTLGNAEALGMHHLIGSIEVGKMADLLILFENPLEDLQVFNRIWGVMKEGHLIKRQIDKDNHS